MLPAQAVQCSLQSPNILTELAPSTFLLMADVTSPGQERGRRVWGDIRWHQVTSLITIVQGSSRGTRAPLMAAGILPRVHRLYVMCKAGIFQLFRVIHRVSDRNYKKLDEDIFVARSHTWSQSSRAGGRPSHFQASLHICWWWASANVIFSWLLFYWLRMSAWLARAGLMPLSVSPTPDSCSPARVLLSTYLS